MKPIDGNEEGRKRLEKIEATTHKIDTLKYIEKKLEDKGMHRMERHPVDGLGGIGRRPPKSGHGGKYTWEGPDDLAESELEAPAALDEKDPNYVDEEEEKGDEASLIIVGEVEVPKVVKEGVGRVEVDPRLQI